VKSVKKNNYILCYKDGRVICCIIFFSFLFLIYKNLVSQFLLGWTPKLLDRSWWIFLHCVYFTILVKIKRLANLKSDRSNPGRCSNRYFVIYDENFVYRWLLLVSIIIIIIICAKEIIIPEFVITYYFLSFVSIARASIALKVCIDILYL